MTSKPIPQTSPTEPAGRFPESPPGTICRTPSISTTRVARRPCAATSARRTPPSCWAKCRSAGTPASARACGFPTSSSPSTWTGPPSLRCRAMPSRCRASRRTSCWRWPPPPPAGTTIPTNGRTTPPSAYPKYSRFDPSDGRHHDAALAGDRLTDGVYQPLGIVRVDEERYRGHSEVLNLDLCWEAGQLRWYDPVERRYLRTFDEEAEDRIAAEGERDAAHERVRELEAEVRRLQGY